MMPKHGEDTEQQEENVVQAIKKHLEVGIKNDHSIMILVHILVDAVMKMNEHIKDQQKRIERLEDQVTALTLPRKGSIH